ncbi:hypothetical protein D9M70_479140 [compost metagenome]
MPRHHLAGAGREVGELYGQRATGLGGVHGQGEHARGAHIERDGLRATGGDRAQVLGDGVGPTPSSHDPVSPNAIDRTADLLTLADIAGKGHDPLGCIGSGMYEMDDVFPGPGERIILPDRFCRRVIETRGLVNEVRKRYPFRRTANPNQCLKADALAIRVHHQGQAGLARHRR